VNEHQVEQSDGAGADQIGPGGQDRPVELIAWKATTATSTGPIFTAVPLSARVSSRPPGAAGW